MEMRDSRVLKKLKAGEIVSCTKVNLSDSRSVEIAAMSGFDCVWVDMEHVPNDYLSLEKQVLAAKVNNADLLVRVSRGGYSDYIRPLEMDASGIMVPHIMSLEDAKKVVKTTRFYPIGLRPVDGGNADGAYCQINFTDYIRQANEKRFIMIQIEDPEPMNELEEIAALDGIDIMFFGPGDFSQGIGAPGDFNNPVLLKAREQIAKVAIKHGKYAGTVGSPANLKELIDMGYKFISIGADVLALGQYFINMSSEFNECVQTCKKMPAH